MYRLANFQKQAQNVAIVVANYIEIFFMIQICSSGKVVEERLPDNLK